MPTIKVVYEFEFWNGKRFVHMLRLDKETVSLIPDRTKPLPSWTILEHHQCTGCPLEGVEIPHCPIAANIADLVESFKDIRSTEDVQIAVRTAERIYLKETVVQKGLSSIFGIIMATSGCLVMNFLKPMARYHLPFSTDEETIIRSISMYLLSQYFTAKRRGKPDLSLENLNRAYSAVQKVNRGICNRISWAVRQSHSQGDAANNAVIILNVLSQLLKTEIEWKLDSFAPLFEGIHFFDQ